MIFLFVVVTIAWIIFDGLNDVGDAADCALVIGQDEYSGDNSAGLERVAKLYKAGEFGKVIVCGGISGAAYDEQASITKNLEQHGVPSVSILENVHPGDTAETASAVAAIMKSHQLASVMLITDYYRMSRLKLALLNAGISDIRKSHVGTARYQDALPIGFEVVALYSYVGRTFLMPAAEKIKEEATTAGDKAKLEAEKAKDTVNKNLDTLPK